MWWFCQRLALVIVKCEAQHKDNGYNQIYILQLYGWYKVKGIQCHFVTAEKYPKEV